MTKTSTISISKFAYSFVSGENLGKEAIFLPAPVGSCSWRCLICLGVATFTARQKQLQSRSQNLHPLPLKSRLPEEKYHAYYSLFKQCFFVMAEALMAEEKYLVHASPVLTKNLRQWGLVQSACQRDIQRSKDKSSNHQSVQVVLLVIYML